MKPFFKVDNMYCKIQIQHKRKELKACFNAPITSQHISAMRKKI